MSARRSLRSPRPRAIGVWIIALLVAVVATIQIRSQVEVARSLVGTDTASLAFLIDDLHRANDSLLAETTDLGQRQSALQSGSSGAADTVLSDEATRLREIEGLVPVHGPGVVMVIDATGLRALDLQDALNNLAVGGAEAIAINDRRYVVGVAVEQTADGVAVGGFVVPPPWTISAIGDVNRLAETATLMTQQLHTDRRVRQATYRVESDIVITAVVSERPYVYGT
jgi:uncharacterized protein YlxW (UPF0749 family)